MPDHVTHPCEVGRTMSAPADIVFNTAMDPARAAWLPRRDGEGEGSYELTAYPAEQEIRWQPVGSTGWAVRLRVEDGGAGVTEATLSAETGDRPDADEVRAALRQSLDDLAAEVEQNFTAG